MHTSRESKREQLVRALGYTEQPGVQYGSADVMPISSEWERRASTRQASFKADVAVPLAQAVVSGSFVGILAGAAFGLEWGALSASCVACATWGWLLLDHNSQLWETSRWLGSDTAAEEPKPPERLVRIELASDDAKHLRWLDLPIEEAKLRRVAQGILGRGLALSRPGLCGAGILTQGEFNKLVAALLEAGLACKGTGNSRQLTASGRALMRELLTTTD